MFVLHCAFCFYYALPVQHCLWRWDSVGLFDSLWIPKYDRTSVFRSWPMPLTCTFFPVGGCLSQDFAWVQSVYDLSYLHHGSPIRRPRLPITTHFADRLAYVLASAGEDGAAWDRILAQYVWGFPLANSNTYNHAWFRTRTRTKLCLYSNWAEKI